MINIDKLNFITAGMPYRTGSGKYDKAFQILKDFNLDGMEIEFVHGVRISPQSREMVKKGIENGALITAHGPYYINLNAREPEKVDASISRILETAQMANELGAYSITYHAAFYLGQDKNIVFNKVKTETQKIIEIVDNENLQVWIRPETTGKGTQWGNLDEIINLSKEFEKVLPCVDFAHIHARCGGKFNTYDEFCSILEKIGNELGDIALNNFHGHVAGIAYSDKGEKHHLIFEESDFNYKDLLKALKTFDIKGALVCESPNIEDDCKILKEYYLSL